PFAFAAPAANALIGRMDNFLNVGPGTPPAIALPPSVYGHSFVRTDALSVGNGATDGGLTGTCTAAGAGCTITQVFKNVPAGGVQNPASPPAPAGVGSCDINARA